VCSKCLSQVTIFKCINHKTFFDYDNVLDSWSRNVYVLCSLEQQELMRYL
jgi:hypothetical protein